MPRSNRNWVRAGALATCLGAVALALSACGDCSSEIEAARAFLDVEANRACEVDDDCVAVTTGCHTFENGICGQTPLNREAAEGPRWRQLSRDLSGCQAGCSICLAALIPSCTAGLCGGRP